MGQNAIKLNQIILGDCLDVMRNIEDKSIDLVLCDLPYGTTSNKWDSIIPLDLLWTEYNRLIKDTGVVLLTGSQPFTSKLVMSNIEMFKHEWIWKKNRGSNFANTVREPFKEHEQVLVFAKGSPWCYEPILEKRSESGASRVNYEFNAVSESTNYRKFTRASNSQGKELRVPSSVQKFNTEVGLHPTQKPVKLFKYLLETYSSEGDVVLDNCAGSGTTAIACYDLKRNFICIEKEPKYYEIAKKRIEEFTNQQKLF